MVASLVFCWFVLSHACKAVELELFKVVESMASCAFVSGRGSDLQFVLEGVHEGSWEGACLAQGDGRVVEEPICCE